MADNYLERRMEDYRNGKLSTRRMSPVSVKRPSMALRVFIIGGNTEAGRRHVRILRKYGWKVAFTDADFKAGRELAQTTGSQHHPVDITDADALVSTIRKAVDLWGALDLILDCSTEGIGDPAIVAEFGVPVIKAF